MCFVPLLLFCVLFPKVQVAQELSEGRPLTSSSPSGEHCLTNSSAEENRVYRSVLITRLRHATFRVQALACLAARLIASFVRGFGCHVAGSCGVADGGCGSSFALLLKNIFRIYSSAFPTGLDCNTLSLDHISEHTGFETA